MELNKNLKTILERINFISRYRGLHERFPLTGNVLEKYSGDMVLQIIESIGYKVKYNKKESFFGLKEFVNDYVFTFNISCKYGVVEFIWDVVVDNERLALGGPWGLTSDLLIGEKSNIRKPAFKNYDELKEILTDVFSIYRDFKNEVVEM